MSIDGTGGPALRSLQRVSVPNQGNGCERCKGERSLLLTSIPTEKALDGAFITPDRPLCPIAGLQLIKPARKNLFRRRRGSGSHRHVFSPVSVFSPVFFRR